MSRLRIFEEDHPDRPVVETGDRSAMARELARIGVDFEQWEATGPVKPGDPSEVVMAAYRADIDRLVAGLQHRAVRMVFLENAQAAHRCSFLVSRSQASRNSNASRCRRAIGMSAPQA